MLHPSQEGSRLVRSLGPRNVTEGELEIERGCLVYSFDIRVPGKSGIDEVMVDPGTGKVLSHTHETPRQEAAEQARDQAARSKRR